LALGGDSNLRVSMLENLRWLEYGQRLRTERRGLLGERPALELLAAATEGGARSLGVEAGALAPEKWADLVAVDLGHPALADVSPDELPEALVFGAPDDAILATAVGGRFHEHRPAWTGPEA
jgi:cytosine/adenosine deaminase-related metal-dependent hydrolase